MLPCSGKEVGWEGETYPSAQWASLELAPAHRRRKKPLGAATAFPGRRENFDNLHYGGHWVGGGDTVGQ